MNNTPLEDQVHDGLHRTVDRLHRTPFTVTDVRTRARRIQRRRTIAAGAVVAAVLAIAVPVGLAVTGPTQRSDLPPATQTPTPSPTPSPTPPRISGTVGIDPRSAPVGDELTVPLVDVDAPSITVGGETTVLPRVYDSLTPYRDGWMGVTNDEGSLTVATLTPDFGIEDGPVATGGLVVSPDGQRIAWTEHDGARWRVISAPAAGGEEPQQIQLPPGPLAATVRPVGFASDTEVVVTRTDPADGSQATLVTVDGELVEVPGLLQATSATPATGVVAGLTRSEGGTSCSAVVDGRARTGTAVWETCDYALGTFSPDGRHVVGFAPDADGEGSPTVSLLDATTGETVVDYEVAGARNQVVAAHDRVAWEDSETLAVIVVTGGRQYVVRLGLDGTVERVGGEGVEAEMGAVALQFGARS